MQHFKLLCMPPLLPPLCITICTTVRKFFDVSQQLNCKKCFLIQKNKNYSCIFKSIIITSPTGLNIVLTKVDARLKQRCINVVPTLCIVVSTLCNVVSTSATDVVSTLCNVEIPMSDFVSFSTSDQRYFNVDPQR